MTLPEEYTIVILCVLPSYTQSHFSAQGVYWINIMETNIIYYNPILILNNRQIVYYESLVICNIASRGNITN